jgi:hypothetical protein
LVAGTHVNVGTFAGQPCRRIGEGRCRYRRTGAAVAEAAMTMNADDTPRKRRRAFTDKSITTWEESRPGPKRQMVPHPGKIGPYTIVQPASQSSSLAM